MIWSNVHIITISHIMHDTFSSYHANIFWREIHLFRSKYLEDESCKQHFTSLFSYGISFWIAKQKCTLYLCCFLVAEFLIIAYAWQFISCHANGFGGKFKKNFTSLWNLLLISMQKSHVTCLLCSFLVAVRAPIDSLLGLCVAPSFKS